MQFAIGSNLRHMSDKVSIFNAAHPCILKCSFIEVLENDCYDMKPPLPGCNYLKAIPMMSLERN